MRTTSSSTSNTQRNGGSLSMITMLLVVLLLLVVPSQIPTATAAEAETTRADLGTSGLKMPTRLWSRIRTTTTTTFTDQQYPQDKQHRPRNNQVDRWSEKDADVVPQQYGTTAKGGENRHRFNVGGGGTATVVSSPWRRRSLLRMRTRTRTHPQSTTTKTTASVPTIATTATSSSIIHLLQKIRGGGNGTGTTTLMSATSTSSLVTLVAKFHTYMGASKARAWCILFVAILVDASSAALLKVAQREASVRKLLLAYCGLITSLSGFAVAIQTLDVSIAYACWAAIGTMVVSVAGMVWLEEPLYPAKLMCLVLIVMGVVGLELLPPPPN